MPSRRACSSAPASSGWPTIRTSPTRASISTRLKPVAETDRRHGDGSGQLLAETARELALGMAYEDTVRVAELKIRPSRFERVRAGGAGRRRPDRRDRRVPASARAGDRRHAAGRARPLAARHRLGAALRRALHQQGPGGEDLDRSAASCMLYFVASLKPTRRRSLRFANEQAFLRRLAAHNPDVAATNYRARGRDRHDPHAGEGLQRHPRARPRALRHADADAAADHGDAPIRPRRWRGCARPRSPTTPARRSPPRSRSCGRCRRRRSSVRPWR